ncbi:MAG: glutaredoxin family protein [Comamonas sp.]|uniref:glutaredoxin family protein n=1 Tax=Comamonas sp. TaxID=34028 RepID=UPI002FC73688
MNNTSHPQVMVYTTPSCPDCRLLKDWLEREAIAFEERDLTDPEIMAQAKARSGVRVAPITLVQDQVFYGTFAAQKPGLVHALGLGPAAADKSAQ